MENGEAQPDSLTSSTGRDFLAFELLRGIAAMIVVFHHHWRSGAFSHAYLAVDFFFMLSGFVMVHAFENKFAEGLTPRAAIRSRIVRLWPTIAVGILFGALVEAAAGSPPLVVAQIFLAQLLFVPIMSSRTGIYPLDGVQWSLLFEIIANLIHFNILWRGKPRALVMVAAGAALVLFIAAACRGNLMLGDRPENIAYGFCRVAFPYTMGILLFRLRPWLNVTRGWLEPVLLLPAVLILASASILSRQWWLDPAIVVLVMPAIVALGAAARVPERWRGVAIISGRLSFPIYAFHLPFLSLGMLIAKTGDIGRIVATPIAFIALTAGSICWAYRARLLALGAGFAPRWGFATPSTFAKHRR